MAVHRVSAKEWNANVDPNNCLRPYSGDIWKALTMIQKGMRVKIDAMGNSERRRKQLHEYATRMEMSVSTRVTKDKKWIYACAVDKFGANFPKFYKRLQSIQPKGACSDGNSGASRSRVSNFEEAACQ